MNLVFQVNIPHKHHLLKDDILVNQPTHAQISQSGFIEYAEWHDADYMFVEEAKLDEETTGLRYPHYYERYQIFTDPYFDQYEKILYVDSDVYPHKIRPNIFDIEGELICMPERAEYKGNYFPSFMKKYSSAWNEIHVCFDKHEIDITYFDDGQIRWYNTGVMITTKNMRKEIRENFLPFTEFKPDKHTMNEFIHIDEMWWILMLTKNNLLDRVTELDNIWNWTGSSAIKGNLMLGDFPEFANFLHFCGGRRKQMMITL